MPFHARNLQTLHRAVESAPALVGVHVHDALAAVHSKGAAARGRPRLFVCFAAPERSGDVYITGVHMFYTFLHVFYT